jgi:hypothetical protein
LIRPDERDQPPENARSRREQNCRIRGGDELSPSTLSAAALARVIEVV